MTITWTITDTALEHIDRELAQPRPERGGVLLGPRHARLITDFLLDPVDGGSVEYFHSDALRRRQQHRAKADPYVTYRGSIHSHPAHMAAPSSPDHKAFASALRHNPTLGDMLFPIVVGRTPDQLSPQYRGEHLLGLPNGTFAPFTALLDDDKVRVLPARVVVLPVGQQTRAISNALGWVTAGIAATAGPDGTPWLRVTWTTTDNTTADLLLPAGYPLAGPLLRAPGEARFTGIAWIPGDDAASQVTAEFARREPTTPPSVIDPNETNGVTLAPTPAGRREQLNARTAHHLPVRADWAVTVLGAGSVGSVMAEALVRSGVPRLTLVDPDDVEPANLSRTVYTAADIGTPKVTALAQRLRSISGDVDVSAVATDIAAWLPTADMTGLDLIVLATDDALAELDVNAAAYPATVPLVSVKMFAKGDAGEILICHPATGGPCLRCLTGSRAAPAGRSVDYGSGRLVAELALGPDIHTVATKAVKVCLALLAHSAGAGPLTDWIAPMLHRQRAMMLTSTTADWGIFGKLGADAVGLDGPYQTLWIPLSGRDSSCPVCGNQPVAADQHGAQSLTYGQAVPTGDDPWISDPDDAPAVPDPPLPSSR